MFSFSSYYVSMFGLAQSNMYSEIKSVILTDSVLFFTLSLFFLSASFIDRT